MSDTNRSFTTPRPTDVSQTTPTFQRRRSDQYHRPAPTTTLSLPSPPPVPLETWTTGVVTSKEGVSTTTRVRRKISLLCTFQRVDTYFFDLEPTPFTPRSQVRESVILLGRRYRLTKIIDGKDRENGVRLVIRPRIVSRKRRVVGHYPCR